jgi:hypothetical protein
MKPEYRKRGIVDMDLGGQGLVKPEYPEQTGVTGVDRA